jgi:hypothetical protein
MPFSAGTLCCSQGMCVLVDTAVDGNGDRLNDGSAYDKIPHVTQMAFTETASTPKIVTSDSNGRELSLCGTVSTTGNLSIACHDGTAPEFCINEEIRVRWAINCDWIWSCDPVSGNCSAVPQPWQGDVYEAKVRITSKPVDFNVSQAGATLLNYGWEVTEWISQGICDVT